MLVSGSVLALGTALVLWTWSPRPGQRKVVATVAVAGLGFQVVHAVEHVVQIVAWVLAPGRSPFLTPWAMAGRDVLAIGGHHAMGDELLHLLGNLVFLGGLVAMAVVVGRSHVAHNRSLRFALAFQGVHVLEHGALTVTRATVGRAIGVTSGFGLLEPGPVLWTVRPMGHFALNMVATVAAGLAVLTWIRVIGSRTGEPEMVRV